MSVGLETKSLISVGLTVSWAGREGGRHVRWRDSMTREFPFPHRKSLPLL